MDIPPTPSAENLRQALTQGEFELKGQFTHGSNYTFLVNLCYEGQDFPAVYKPQRGERPLWDFPDNSLAGREVAAWHVSETLGWGIVPFTCFREEGPLGPGSLQQFIDHNPNYHYFNFRPKDKNRLVPVALFDHITNNADRKGGHVFFEKTSHQLYAIDHGLCFHVEDKLRTVIWDFAGQEIPTELLTGMETLLTALPDSLSAVLEAYLLPEELDALTLRTQELFDAKAFPFPPPDRRSYPYPPL